MTRADASLRQRQPHSLRHQPVMPHSSTSRRASQTGGCGGVRAEGGAGLAMRNSTWRALRWTSSSSPWAAMPRRAWRTSRREAAPRAARTSSADHRRWGVCPIRVRISPTSNCCSGGSDCAGVPVSGVSSAEQDDGQVHRIGDQFVPQLPQARDVGHGVAQPFVHPGFGGRRLSPPVELFPQGQGVGRGFHIAPGPKIFHDVHASGMPCPLKAIGGHCPRTGERCGAAATSQGRAARRESHPCRYPSTKTPSSAGRVTTSPARRRVTGHQDARAVGGPAHGRGVPGGSRTSSSRRSTWPRSGRVDVRDQGTPTESPIRGSVSCHQRRAASSAADRQDWPASTRTCGGRRDDECSCSSTAAGERLTSARSTDGSRRQGREFHGDQTSLMPLEWHPGSGLRVASRDGRPAAGRAGASGSPCGLWSPVGCGRRRLEGSVTRQGGERSLRGRALLAEP